MEMDVRTLIPVPWDGCSNRDLGLEKRVCEGAGHELFPMQPRFLDEGMREKRNCHGLLPAPSAPRVVP